MTALTKTIAACNASVIEQMRRPFADRLPPRNVEAECIAAWRAVDTLTTADTRDLRENVRAIAEIQERLEFIMERIAG